MNETAKGGEKYDALITINSDSAKFCAKCFNSTENEIKTIRKSVNNRNYRKQNRDEMRLLSQIYLFTMTVVVFSKNFFCGKFKHFINALLEAFTPFVCTNN